MASPQPGTDAWHDLVQEEILDPDRPIVDPLHHLWETHSMWGVYTLDDLWNDTESGHNIQKTVFIDCHSNYRTNGPDHLKPIGETEYGTRRCRERRNRQQGDNSCDRQPRKYAAR